MTALALFSGSGYVHGHVNAKHCRKKAMSSTCFAMVNKPMTSIAGWRQCQVLQDEICSF